MEIKSMKISRSKEHGVSLVNEQGGAELGDAAEEGGGADVGVEILE